MREAGEVVAIAHLLARGDDTARQPFRGIRNRRTCDIVAVDLVEPYSADRKPHRIRRLGRLDETEVKVEAVGVHRDAVVAAVVLLRLLERHHNLDELLRLAGIRNRPRLERLRDIRRRPRIARSPASVVAVARRVAEVEDSDRARRFVRVVDDEHVGFVRDDALALADAPRDVAARVALVVHHARRYVEDVLHRRPAGWILAEHVIWIVRQRERAVDFVHERERTIVFKAIYDLVALRARRLLCLERNSGSRGGLALVVHGDGAHVVGRERFEARDRNAARVLARDAVGRRPGRRGEVRRRRNRHRHVDV